MKNKEHILAYLASIGIIEIFALAMFVLAFIDTHDRTVWAIFGWLQFMIPFISVLPWLVIEGLMYADTERKAEEEWNKRVEEVVKYIENERKNKE